ncbi:MAG: hypothetical protein A2X86_00860 [Bdellovibrionales bacterium GWA2_49_15]|nr:MAG: hypothetical protein A2X86_00860 [Bdellovibrionales bacterium GWA2_49_15]HAZ14588.1 hypothetical protein [Bdellovibrionales bacterium]
MKKLNLVVGILSLLTLVSTAQASAPKVIYGVDNRQEIGEYPDARFREMALSVAGKVRKFKLQSSRFGENFVDFPHTMLSYSQNVCSKERYADQYTLPHCTGFLIAPDLIMTAGHCVTNQMDCDTSSWIFDYLPQTEYLEKKNVYNCVRIVQQELSSSFFKMRDYAIIQLDRKAGPERRPLKLRLEGKVRVGTPVVVIGHPTGLPLKIADNAKIRSFNIMEMLLPIRSMVRRNSYFNSDLDTFAGNSGSPVFNQETGEVEGILVQGAKDYVPAPGEQCLIPARRAPTHWAASEKSFRVTQIKNLKKILKVP